jgi:MFS family permease
VIWDEASRRWVPRVLPNWWLCFLDGFCMVPAITNSVVLPLLLPPLIERMVGQEKKAGALGVLSSVVYVLGFSMPFLGAISDRMGGSSFGRRFGRRRPFIVLGQLCNSGGLCALMFAERFE